VEKVENLQVISTGHSLAALSNEKLFQNHGQVVTSYKS